MAQESTKTFMTDDEGNPRLMRLMSLLALLVAATLAGVEVSGVGNPESRTELVLCFLVVAFAPKAARKFVEKKVQ